MDGRELQTVAALLFVIALGVADFVHLWVDGGRRGGGGPMPAVLFAGAVVMCLLCFGAAITLAMLAGVNAGACWEGRS